MPIRLVKDKDFAIQTLNTYTGKNIRTAQWVPLYFNVKDALAGKQPYYMYRGQLGPVNAHFYKTHGQPVIFLQNSNNTLFPTGSTLAKWFAKMPFTVYLKLPPEFDLSTITVSQTTTPANKYNGGEVISYADYLQRLAKPKTTQPKPKTQTDPNILYMAKLTQEQRIGFFKKVLALMKLEPTYNRMLWLMAQSEVENTAAKNNPLATTWNMASVDKGQTNFNSIGVRNYSTPEIGARATANTLLQKAYYPYMLQMLQADTSPLSPTLNQATLQKEFTTYGGAAGYWALLKARAAGAALQAFVKKNYKAMGAAGLGLMAFFAFLLLRNLKVN